MLNYFKRNEDDTCSNDNGCGDVDDGGCDHGSVPSDDGDGSVMATHGGNEDDTCSNDDCGDVDDHGSVLGDDDGSDDGNDDVIMMVVMMMVMTMVVL